MRNNYILGDAVVEFRNGDVRLISNIVAVTWHRPANRLFYKLTDDKGTDYILNINSKITINDKDGRELIAYP